MDDKKRYNYTLLDDHTKMNSDMVFGNFELDFRNSKERS